MSKRPILLITATDRARFEAEYSAAPLEAPLFVRELPVKHPIDFWLRDLASAFNEALDKAEAKRRRRFGHRPLR